MKKDNRNFIKLVNKEIDKKEWQEKIETIETTIANSFVAMCVEAELCSYDDLQKINTLKSYAKIHLLFNKLENKFNKENLDVDALEDINSYAKTVANRLKFELCDSLKLSLMRKSFDHLISDFWD